MNDGSMDPAEHKCLEDIEQFGCHVVHVAEEDGLPPFAYSVGITRITGSAEAIVIGLKQQLAHFVINEYNRRVRAHERFAVGSRYAGFIGGFDCELRHVSRAHYEEHLGWCRRLHDGDDFPAIQIVYPNTAGIWPWEAEASEWFRARQPLLG